VQLAIALERATFAAQIAGARREAETEQVRSASAQLRFA